MGQWDPGNSTRRNNTGQRRIPKLGFKIFRVFSRFFRVFTPLLREVSRPPRQNSRGNNSGGDNANSNFSACVNLVNLGIFRMRRPRQFQQERRHKDNTGHSNGDNGGILSVNFGVWSFFTPLLREVSRPTSQCIWLTHNNSRGGGNGIAPDGRPGVTTGAGRGAGASGHPLALCPSSPHQKHRPSAPHITFCSPVNPLQAA